MDWTFWGCAALSVLIAVSLSSLELLTKYRTRNLGEIFWSRYYFWFALLNALFCFLVYLAVPYLKIEVNSNFISVGNPPLVRALVAGFGYLVIARTSLLDIRTAAGEPVGVGFDFIYNGVAQYLLGFQASGPDVSPAPAMVTILSSMIKVQNRRSLLVPFLDSLEGVSTR